MPVDSATLVLARRYLLPFDPKSRRSVTWSVIPGPELFNGLILFISLMWDVFCPGSE